MNTMNEVREMRVRMLKNLAHLGFNHNSNGESLVDSLAQIYDSAAPAELAHSDWAVRDVNIACACLEPARPQQRITRHHRVFCLLNGTQLPTDHCWEGFQFIAHHTLHHLTLCIDFKPQRVDILSATAIEPLDLPAKFRAFGFKIDIINHDKTMMPYQITVPCQQHETSAALHAVDDIDASYLKQLLFQHQLRLLPEIQVELEKVIAGLEAEYV